jgi:4-hydroxy-tetrahydrodipicolinate synthase
MTRFGLSAALSTPFDDAGHLDVPRMVAHAQWCLANGCGSVTLFGTTGEGASIGLAARGRVFDAMLKAGIAPKTQLLSTIAASSVEDAADQANMALDVGVRGLLLTPPFYFRAIDDDGIFNWFAALFSKLGPKARDMFAYHLPSVVGVPLSIALIGRLKTAFPGVIVGVKDSSGSWANTQALLAEHGDLMILVGHEPDLARAVRGGGSGAISGMANIAPALVRGAAVDGRDDARLNAAVTAICRNPVLASIKTIIAHQKRDPAWLRMRAPLHPLAVSAAAALVAEYDAAVSGPSG